MLQPIQFAVYKGMGGKFGAAQFNLQKPHRVCSGCRKRDFTGQLMECCNEKTTVRDGAVFLEVTSTTSGKKNEYDWTKKITVALSITDISKLLYGIRTATEGSEVKLMHDPGAASESKGKVQKHVSLNSPQGPSKGFMLNVAQFSGQADKIVHTVPLSPEEALVVSTLFAAAIPQLLAWS